MEQLLAEGEPGRVCCLWSSLSSSGVDSQQTRQLSIGLDQLLENVSCWRYRESEPGILPGGQLGTWWGPGFLGISATAAGDERYVPGYKCFVASARGQEAKG